MKSGSLGIPTNHAARLGTLVHTCIDETLILAARVLKSPYFRTEPFVKKSALRLLPSSVLRHYLYYNGLAKWALKNEAREKCSQLVSRHLDLPVEAIANQDIVRRLFCHLEQWSPPANATYWRKNLKIDRFVGKENLNEAQHRGQGLIVVCAHVGPFKHLPWFFQKLGLQADVYFPLVWPLQEATKPGSGTGFLLKAVRALKQNGIVALMGDLSWGRAVTIPFLKTRLDFPMGFASLAHHTGATILPTFCLADCNDRILVQLGRALWRDQYRGSKQEQVLEMTKTYVGCLEQIVKHHPDNACKYFLGTRLNSQPPKRKSHTLYPQTIDSSLFGSPLLAEGF